MAPSGRGRGATRIAFFGHDCTELTVIKRARAFAAAGHEVQGFTFRRERLNRGYRPEWPDLNLGTTADGRYGQRLLKLAQAVVRLAGARHEVRACDLLYARNIDMAALALVARRLAGSRAPLVYEVLDVQRLFTSRGVIGSLLRFVERRLLGRTELLVVSSEAFVRAYFRPIQGFAGRWFLLENKIFGLDAAGLRARPAPDQPPARPCPPHGPWVIAWLGNLRCPRSPALLRNVAEALGPRVRIEIHGVPVVDGVERFQRRFAGLDNVVYAGEYRGPGDLPAIYRRAHFAWAFDWFEAGANSDWLLPNRLYEAGFFGVPALALAGTETGRRVRDDGLGWAVDEPVAGAVVDLLHHLDEDAYRARRRALLGLPRATFLDDGDTGAMVRAALGSSAAGIAAAAGPAEALPATGS